MFNTDQTSVYAVVASKLYPFTIYARKVKDIQVFFLEMDERPTSPRYYEDELLLALSHREPASQPKFIRLSNISSLILCKIVE
jgi:hypothetical protein